MPDERGDPAAIVAANVRGPVMRPIAEALARGFGEWIPSESVIAAAYANDPDGGPMNASGSVSVVVHYLRRRLEQFGIVIDGKRSWGYRMRWRE